MAVSSFSVTKSCFVSVSVRALAAWLVSHPACLYCLVESGISVSSALLTLQDRGNPYRGPSSGHQRGQSERKASERGHPSLADGRRVGYPQDQEKKWQYVLLLLNLFLFNYSHGVCKNYMIDLSKTSKLNKWEMTLHTFMVSSWSHRKEAVWRRTLFIFHFS